MSRIHYIHFGMPRSGSSWLFNELVEHPSVDYDGIKEDPFFTDAKRQLSEYTEKNSVYDVSLNFNPWMWALDSDQLATVRSISTHRTICFRNPYEFLESWYNFVGTQNRGDRFVDLYLEFNFADYTRILKRLQSQMGIVVLYYDDLVSDPQRFYDSVTQYLGMTRKNVDASKINTKHSNDSLIFSSEQIKIINNSIDVFSEYTHRDFGHWKR